MSSEHTISIATTSNNGPDRRVDTRPVPIPVDELLGSSGLVTGQSGAEPVVSVRRIVEGMLQAGETTIVVDPAGDFGELADRSSVLHAGGDRGCDVHVTADAADRIAGLAVDGNTSILLDLSAYGAGTADDVLAALTDALLESGRDVPGQLLLVLAGCHRWLAAEEPATHVGENLLALGGRRHDAVGVLGATDQPADLRDEVIDGIDWLLAHRLTWREDVRVMRGLLGRAHATDLEDLADDEAFFHATWADGIQRVRIREDGVDRDGPAAERPADDDRSAREPTSNDPERGSESSSGDTNFDDGLLAGLSGARSPASDDASTDEETAAEETAVPTDQQEELDALRDRVARLEGKIEARDDLETLADRIADAITESVDEGTDRRGDPTSDSTASGRTDAGSTDRAGSSGNESRDSAGGDPSEDGMAGGFGDVFGMFDDDTDGSTDDSSVDTTVTPDQESADDATAVTNGQDRAGEAAESSNGSTAPNGSTDSDGMSFEPIDFGFDEPEGNAETTVPEDFGGHSRRATAGRSIPRYLRSIVRGIEEMDVTTRRMLAHYLEGGEETPLDAHFSAGGSGDRTRAYAHNRRLRTAGMVEHVGKGKYAPRLCEYVVDQAGHSVPDHELDRAVEVIHQTAQEA